MKATTAVATAWWSSADVSPHDVPDAWESAMSSCYLTWRLTKRPAREFSARIRQRVLDSLRLIQCECSPCSGHRVAQHISIDPEPYIGLQIIHEGVEHFSLGNERVTVGRGDLVIWSSGQPTEFDVVEPLHKSTLMIPLSAVESRLPRGANICGGIVDARTGVGALLYSHIHTLTNQFAHLTPTEAMAAKWATLELAATAAARLNQHSQQTLTVFHLNRVQNYILANLQDSDLTVEHIANANRISVRYLHKIFASSERTVSRWVLDQRLERCRSELATNWNSRCVVKDVAFRWGFKDSAHFSRVFKQRFGLSPHEYWLSAQGVQP